MPVPHLNTFKFHVSSSIVLASFMAEVFQAVPSVRHKVLKITAGLASR